MLKNASEQKLQPPSPETRSGNSKEKFVEGVAVTKTESSPPRFVAPTHTGVDILKLLTELEDLVENTKRGPMGTLFRFPEDQFHMTIMKIRANLPEEMKRASKLARESERVVEEARDQAERIVEDSRKSVRAEYDRGKTDAEQMREEARRELQRLRETAEREARQVQDEARVVSQDILAEARTQATQLISDSEIVQQAQTQAHDLQSRAAQEAAAIRRGADDYARDVLSNLEAVLDKAVNQVQRGREMLDRAG